MIGISELILVVIIAIALLHPDKLPSYAEALRKAINTMRSVKQEAQDIVQPYKDLKDEIQDAVSISLDKEDSDGSVNG